MLFFIKLKTFFRNIVIQNSTNMTSNTKTPFCKVCFDAKKSKDEYTSHWVKSAPGPNGVVVCPYLLSIKCRYCKAKGHTPRCCPVLKNRQAIKYIREPEIDFNICEDFITFRPPKNKLYREDPTLKQRINGFDGLTQYSDSEDGSRQEVEVVPTGPLKWADIVSKPPVLKRSTAVPCLMGELDDKSNEPEYPVLTQDDDEFLRKSATGQKMSWADYCDSD
jgi:hypothetical protein